MFGFLSRLFRSRGRDRALVQKRDERDDLEWLFPPNDMHDSAVWDRFWSEQAAHGLGPPLFDMFSQDDDLIKVMLQNGMRSVLCSGSGVSQEPRALAEGGFEVTALDLSPTALQLAQAWPFEPSDLAQFFSPALRRAGGRLECVVGDLLDPSICPGPFDVIIERRTLQLFSPDERNRAFDTLAGRLQPEGIFYCHCHDGRWKPPAPRLHPLRGLFHERGWIIFEGQLQPKPKGRVAWLLLSTG